MDLKTRTYCVGGRPCSNTNNIVEYEKIIPKTQRVVKVRNGICDICGRSKQQSNWINWLKEKNFKKGAKCKNNHSSAMSNTAWCDLNAKCDTLKLHDVS